MRYTVVNVASANSIERQLHERRRKDEEDCSKKFRLCICYILLCCSCLLLVEAIVGSIILYNMDYTTDGESLNVYDYEEGSWSWSD